jgi:hypothetical protein
MASLNPGSLESVVVWALSFSTIAALGRMPDFSRANRTFCALAA